MEELWINTFTKYIIYKYQFSSLKAELSNMAGKILHFFFGNQYKKRDITKTEL